MRIIRYTQGLYAYKPNTGAHGWQFHASTALEKRFVQSDILPILSSSQRALLLSQSGANSARFLTATPTTPETTFRPGLLEVAIKRRLRLPLPTLTSHCDGTHCTERVDNLGDHRTNCTRTGRLKRRSVPMERMWARVFREAGAQVTQQKCMSELDLGVQGLDGRRVDFVAYGLPIFSGMPIAGDSTMVSPVTGAGTAIAVKAGTQAGVALERATAKKHKTYPEFTSYSIAPKAKFYPLPCEVGGRWGSECLEIVRLLAKCKARDEPDCLRRSVELGKSARWWAMLSVTAQSVFAASLLDNFSFQAVDDLTPDPFLENVLSDNAYDDGPPVSRLGA